MALVKTIANFQTTLAGKVNPGDTTGTLSAATDSDGVALATGTYGFTIDRKNSSVEYITCTLTGTAMTNVKTLTVAGGVASTGFGLQHRKGAEVILSNFVAIKRIQDVLETGYSSATSPTTDYQLATKKYVDDIALGGTTTIDRVTIVGTAGETITAGQLIYLKAADSRWWLTDADTTATVENVILGIAQGAGTAGNPITNGVLINGVDANQTGLTANTVYYASNTAGEISTTAGTKEVTVGIATSTTQIMFSPNFNQELTEDEQDALVGSQGIPTASNKFVTEDNVSVVTTDQTQTTQNSSIETGEADTTIKKNKIAQSFIPTKTKIRSVNLYKSANTGTFTGTVTVTLEADTTGSPSGSALATKTFTNVEYNALAVGDFEAVFSAEYASLVVGSLYWIVIVASTSDNSNHPNLGINTAGGYSNGSVKYWNTTDSWTSIATIDLYFKTNEGLNSQVVKTNTSGKIPSGIINSTSLPAPSFYQRIPGPIQAGARCRASTANSTGNVFFAVHNYAAKELARYERDAITGMFFATHYVNMSVPIPANDIGSMVVLGNYIYVFTNDGTNMISYRYLAADLTGEQLMTVPTVACTSHTSAWTDGTYVYVMSDTTNTTSRKWSLSGTTFTAVATASVTVTLIEDNAHASFFDGTYPYVVSHVTTTGLFNIYKLTTVDGSVKTTTTKSVDPSILSDADDGVFAIPIGTDRMYIGFSEVIYDETAAVGSAINLFPITKP